MMRKMRENTKWIMLVTAIAFVALMVFEWGMDITGRTAGSVGEIGRVDGTPVTYEQYQAAYRNLYEQMSQNQEDPITAAQNREIEEAAWNEVVNQVLIQEELARRGIRVTDEEIRQAARFSPPPELMGDPYFQTDGQFDIQKYQEFLATSADQLFLLQLEAYYRDVIPRSKLLRQVTTGIYFTDAELWERYKEANEQIRVRFVGLNPRNRIPDDSVTVTEDEIQAYYREHEEDFQIPASAQVKYVSLTKAPLREDTLAARERAESTKEELEEGADFAEVAQRESADEATASQGGSLGTFTRGRMVPAFDSVAFNAPVNEVQGPVQTNFGFHLIEVQNRWADSVQARHILLPIERTNESELRLLTLADSLEVLGEVRTLDDAAGELGLPVQSQEMTELFPFLPGVGQISDGLEWVFEEGAPGEVSPVFEDAQAFYMMELVNREPAGVQTLEQARGSIEQILRIEKKTELALVEAEELAREAREAGSLEVLDGRAGLTVREAGPASRNQFFQGLGIQNRAVGRAFGLEVGEVSDPVEAENNVFLVQTLERIEADSAAWEAQKEQQRNRLELQLEQQRLQQWIAGLRENADIVDRREEVFQASEQTQAAQTGGLF